MPRCEDDPLGVRAAYPITDTRTYLNTAYIGPLSTPAQNAADAYSREKLTWAASRHQLENKETARIKFATLFGANPKEVALLYSTSDGENIVARGLGLKRGDNVVVDELHFPTAFLLYRQLEKERGIELRIVPENDGRVELERYEDHIDQRTRLVSVAWVSNRNGYRQDLQKLAALVHQHGALLYADAVQAIGTFPVELTNLGVDFLACGSYKWLFANFGVAPFFIREEHLDRIGCDRYGHTQIVQTLSEHRFQIHTSAKKYEYASLAFGPVAELAAALDYLERIGLPRIEAHTVGLAQQLRERVFNMGLDTWTPAANSSPIVSFKHACNPTHLKQQFEKEALDVTFREQNDEIIRVAIALFNNRADIDRLIAVIEQAA